MDGTDNGSCTYNAFPASKSLGCGSHSFTNAFGNSADGFSCSLS
jgi:hypothetical protein